MKIITYCLHDKFADSSNVYYTDISNFTDMVLERASHIGGDVINEYLSYLAGVDDKKLQKKMNVFLNFLF